MSWICPKCNTENIHMDTCDVCGEKKNVVKKSTTKATPAFTVFQPVSRYCNRCGKPYNKSTSNFCSYCGKEIKKM